jgi:hypothetical protein
MRLQDAIVSVLRENGSWALTGGITAAGTGRRAVCVRNDSSPVPARKVGARPIECGRPLTFASGSSKAGRGNGAPERSCVAASRLEEPPFH